MPRGPARFPPVRSPQLGIAAGALALAVALKPPFKPIAEQVIRAAASIPANVAEGQGRS
ncbi:MAG: four helix bundle protein, partial [Acidobacteriota bacterium]